MLVDALGGWRATAFALAALLALGLAGVQSYRLQDAHADLAKVSERAALAEAAHARAAKDASELARLREHELATRANAIGQAYERGKDDAKRKADAVAADLRAGNLRLRDEWRGCEARRVSDPAAPAGSGDAAAQRRIEAAGAVVRVGAEADAQLAACQAVIRTYIDGQHASRPGD